MTPTCSRGKCRNIPPPGRTRCDYHRNLTRQADAQRRHRRYARGQCRDCHSPRLSDSYYCQLHAQYHSDFNVQWRGQTERKLISRWNPNTKDWILGRLWNHEPYLRRDWQTAKKFIEEHLELWMPNNDTALFQATELTQLHEMFNVYLDGAPNMLENGIRLGASLAPDYYTAEE